MARDEKFEILEGITSADIALRIYGVSADDLFRNAGRALVAVMLENPDAVALRDAKTITLENSSLDLLLFNFLDELLFFKDSESLLMAVISVTIDERNGSYFLRSEAAGERIDRTRHRFSVDVKAVTMHRLAVEKKKDGWTATVVLDV
jgi:SHS2 domain-containing protein